MIKSVRLRFSLATLLLVVSWSAPVLWLNTTALVPPPLDDSDNNECSGIADIGFGWPWEYTRTLVGCVDSYQRVRVEPAMLSNYRALVGDAVVGILLVAVLTCTSAFLLRRASHVFRRAESPVACPL